VLALVHNQNWYCDCWLCVLLIDSNEQTFEKVLYLFHPSMSNTFGVCCGQNFASMCATFHRVPDDLVFVRFVCLVMFEHQTMSAFWEIWVESGAEEGGHRR